MKDVKGCYLCGSIEFNKRPGNVRDNPELKVLECAQESKADYIVSGDVHLLGIKEYAGTKILTPNEFLELLDE